MTAKIDGFCPHKELLIVIQPLILALPSIQYCVEYLICSICEVQMAAMICHRADAIMMETAHPRKRSKSTSGNSSPHCGAHHSGALHTPISKSEALLFQSQIQLKGMS